MIETLLSSVLSSTLILKNPTFAPKPQTPPITFTRVLPEKNYVSYVAEKNENLGDVSLRYYGSADYWTNLWNDNPQIANPDDIAGKLITINVNKTDKPAGLTPELSARQDQINQQKNQAYLQSIGYAPAATPTETPTQTPSNPATNSSSTDSGTSTTVTNSGSSATPAPTITPTPTVTVTQTTTTPASTATISDAAITYLGSCEAGMDPTKNTGNGYYGAFQFSAGTWNSMNTGYARADLAPIDVQEAAVKQLLQRSSIYSQFPACAVKMRGAGLI